MASFTGVLDKHIGGGLDGDLSVTVYVPFWRGSLSNWGMGVAQRLIQEQIHH